MLLVWMQGQKVCYEEKEPQNLGEDLSIIAKHQIQVVAISFRRQ